MCSKEGCTIGAVAAANTDGEVRVSGRMRGGSRDALLVVYVHLHLRIAVTAEDHRALLMACCYAPRFCL